MTIQDQIQSRQRIIDEFNRRRNRELVAMIPCAAGVFGFMMANEDPEFHVGPLHGEALFAVAIGLVIVCVIHHLLNWRCPSCEKGLKWGWNVPLCPRCGAIFQAMKEEPFTDPAEVLRKQEEKALQTQVGLYRAKYALHFLRGFGILVVGLVLFFFLVDEGPKRNAELGLSGGAVLIGLLWTGFAIHKLTVGARRYAEQTRLFLDSKRSSLS